MRAADSFVYGERRTRIKHKDSFFSIRQYFGWISLFWHFHRSNQASNVANLFIFCFLSSKHKCVACAVSDESFMSLKFHSLRILSSKALAFDKHIFLRERRSQWKIQLCHSRGYHVIQLQWQFPFTKMSCLYCDAFILQ